MLNKLKKKIDYHSDKQSLDRIIQLLSILISTLALIITLLVLIYK